MSSCAHFQGWRGVAGRRSAVSGAAVVLVLLAGCAAQADVPVNASLEPRADLARRATTTSMPGSASPGAPGEELVSVADPAADHGDGPEYADLAQVELHEHDDRVRMNVSLARAVPRRLRSREAQAVGIDVFRAGSDDSDFQVLLDGGRTGWRAFLHTPDGYVDFPGLFTVDGANLQVDLPWSAIGGRDEAEVSVFVDWSLGIDRLSTDGTLRVPVPVE